MRILSAIAFLLIAAGGPALAKECRMPDGSPGVRIQLPPGCKDIRTDRMQAGRQEALRSNQGFIDLGNGTQVRIGGRVRAEVAGRR